MYVLIAKVLILICINAQFNLTEISEAITYSAGIRSPPVWGQLSKKQVPPPASFLLLAEEKNRRACCADTLKVCAACDSVVPVTGFFVSDTE